VHPVRVFSSGVGKREEDKVLYSICNEIIITDQAIQALFT
jgi:hypothetical protein